MGRGLKPGVLSLAVQGPRPAGPSLDLSSSSLNHPCFTEVRLAKLRAALLKQHGLPSSGKSLSHWKKLTKLQGGIARATQPTELKEIFFYLSTINTYTQHFVKPPEGPGYSQWCRTQQLEEDGNDRSLPNHSYRTWRQENGMALTQADSHRHQPYSEFQEQPANRGNSVGYGNQTSGNFNFNAQTKRPAVAQTVTQLQQSTNNLNGSHFQSFQAQPMIPDWSSNDRSNGMVATISNACYPRAQLESQNFRARAILPNVIQSKGTNPYQPVNIAVGQLDSWSHDSTIQDESCYHQPYQKQVSQQQPLNVGLNAIGNYYNPNCNKKQGSRTTDFRDVSTGSLYGKSQLVKRLKGSTRMVSCSTEAVHMWRNTLGDNASVVFELFGKAMCVQYDGLKLSFELKGKSLHIGCVYFCMDRGPLGLTDGMTIRVVGRMEPHWDKFQCVSVRLATDDEKSSASKLIQTCNNSLHRFNVFGNEP
ncbi:uncharacterized protein [Watersipora subatra]|uniref:uncharacterized protein n=1 Tax=Watersipora subatra TaxID=2589382 RepID=UPI00355C8A56